MAETVLLCLCYITESSSESLKSYETSVAANDAINLLKVKAENGNVEALDISSLAYSSPVQWIEILSSVYTNMQDSPTKMNQRSLGRDTKKARGVGSGHTVERGEASGSQLSPEKSMEAVVEANKSSDLNSLVKITDDSVEAHSEQNSFEEVCTGDNIELEVLIKRAFRLSLTDGLEFARLTVAETQYTNKGKEPIRPVITEKSSFFASTCWDDEGGPSSSNNNKRPLQPAPKRNSISSTRFLAIRRLSTQSTKLGQSTTKTVVRCESREVDKSTELFESDNKRVPMDDSWKSNASGSNDSDSECDISEDEDQELRHQLDCTLKNSPASAITVRPYISPMTGQDVFLFNHGIVIPRKDVSKLVYGVAIPGKIFRQNKSRYSSTFAFLVAMSKANLDILGIGTANTDLIRTLILDDAEEVYRKGKYGDYTWIGIAKERKSRYDPDTRPWFSIFNPSQWRRHGLVLPEGQNPPENSCKFRMVTMCGKVMHQWYVRCDLHRAFGPRNIIARISCGEDGTCEKFLDWEPDSGPMVHNESTKRWTEIDPDREGVGLPELFYPFMKFWIIEGPPSEEPPPGCMRINCVTRCGLVKGKIRLLCPRHISKNAKCIGGEFTMLIDRGCALRDDIDRCDEQIVCEGYLTWLNARLGLQAENLSVKQANDLDRLHTTLVAAYNKETDCMGSFLKHKYSEKKWRDVIYNHVDYYEMLFGWGLTSIRFPEGLSVIRADEFILSG